MKVVLPKFTVGEVLQGSKHKAALFPVAVGRRLPAEEVMVQVAAAARGYVRLPLEFEIDAPATSASAGGRPQGPAVDASATRAPACLPARSSATLARDAAAAKTAPTAKAMR